MTLIAEAEIQPFALGADGRSAVFNEMHFYDLPWPTAALEELVPVTLPLSPDAQRACLRALGSAADAVGFAVPLAQYSQAQALHVIDAVIHAYERQLQHQSRASRGLPPLDDFEDSDIPF